MSVCIIANRNIWPALASCAWRSVALLELHSDIAVAQTGCAVGVRPAGCREVPDAGPPEELAPVRRLRRQRGDVGAGHGLRVRAWGKGCKADETLLDATETKEASRTGCGQQNPTGLAV